MYVGTLIIPLQQFERSHVPYDELWFITARQALASVEVR